MITKPFFGRQLNKNHLLTKGLVGRWLFNEGDGTIINDLSGNDNYGTMINMDPVTDWVGGKYGYALDFDGYDDYIDVGSGISLDLSGPVTVIVSVKPDVNNTAMVFYKGHSKYVLWVQSNNELRFADSQGTGCDTAAGILTIGSWNHVAGVFSGTSGTTVSLSNCLIYVNGISQATHTIGSIWLPSIWNNGEIGSDGIYDFNGLISDVSIYDRALSASEIQQLYFEPFCMFEYLSVAKYFVIPVAYFKSLIEEIRINSSLQKQVSKPFIEDIELTDIFLKQFSVVKSEIINLDDSFTKLVGKFFSEISILIDNLSKVATLARTFIETLNISDSIEKEVRRTLIEFVTLTDEITTIVISEFLEIAKILANEISAETVMSSEIIVSQLLSREVEDDILKS